MNEHVAQSPYQQNDPTPSRRDRHRTSRMLVFFAVASLGAALLITGQSLQTVLLTLFGVGLAGAMVARWVCDDTPLPTITSVLGQPSTALEQSGPIQPGVAAPEPQAGGTAAGQ